MSIKQKNKGNITKPCFLTLIRITMVLLSSAILVRYMKVYPQFFSLNVTNLCFDYPLLNIEWVLFSRIVSRKYLSKTFLVLVWILIERPYKWRHQLKDDLIVFKARNLRTFHCLRCCGDHANSARRSLVWNESQDSLLPPRNSRFVLSWTLTFGYVKVSYFFLKKNTSQFKETVIKSVQIALTVLTGYFCSRKKVFF